MRTRFSQIAAVAFFALFILVGNVNAEGTERNASNHENIEATLEIENWMINDNFWNSTEIVAFENTNEATLELEGWMTNDLTWELKKSIEIETEQELAVEPWMTNDNNWNR